MRAAILKRRGMTWAVVLSISLAVPATAQRWALREVREWGLAGATAALAIPVGEFAEHVGAGGGMTGFLTLNLDRAGITALRIDGSALAYGRATELTSLDPYYYAVGATTTSFIVGVRAGPQVTLGSGPVRLYGFGQAGFSYFATTTSFGDYGCYCGGYDDVTEQDDFTPAWEAGGGMLVRLGGYGSRVLLDLGARYLHNGRAQYLPARMVGDGSALPLETQANLVALHLGVTVGLR